MLKKIKQIRRSYLNVKIIYIIFLRYNNYIFLFPNDFIVYHSELKFLEKLGKFEEAI